jgi:hypothetical protein
VVATTDTEAVGEEETSYRFWKIDAGGIERAVLEPNARTENIYRNGMGRSRGSAGFDTFQQWMDRQEAFLWRYHTRNMKG